MVDSASRLIDAFLERCMKGVHWRRRLRPRVGRGAKPSQAFPPLGPSPQPRTVVPALRAYLEELPNLLGGYEPSIFWHRQLEYFHSSETYRRTGELDDEQLGQLVIEGSYGFEDLPADLQGPADDSRWWEAQALADRVRLLVKRTSPKATGAEKDVWEHMRALEFMRRQGLLEDYELFIAPLRVRSSMTVARHYFYARLLDQLAMQHMADGPLNILEIGAGAGNLAVFLHRIGRVASYCIIDLPEMLVHSAYTVQKYIPDARLSFRKVQRTVDARPCFSFLPAQDVGVVPEQSYELCLNFNSFMEMDEDARDAYIQLVYRATRPGGMFFNANRRQRALPQRDGSTFDNNPLLYPYSADDRVLLWEEDPFQQDTRTQFGSRPSLAIMRASLVAPLFVGQRT
jgi:hypothetical protein